MKEEQYIKITDWLQKNSRRKKGFCFLYYFLPILVSIIYGLTIFYEFFERNFEGNHLAELLIGPVFVFFGVTWFRKKANFPRPYTVYEYSPMIPKGKAGESFPSRHTVSACAIAVPFFFQNRLVFVLMVLLSILIAISRILAGVHFVRDVVWGAIIGYACTFILTLLIHRYL